MDYVKPAEVLQSMIDTGKSKAELSTAQLLIRGGLAGAILACATTLAMTASGQTGIPMAGAVLFPVGFVIIVLLGLELVTGSFALIPLAVLEKKATVSGMLKNYFWVIVGHLIGCGLYALGYIFVATKAGTDLSNPLIATLVSTSEAKTTAYKALGADGMLLVFVKAILCNWMVTLGAVMAMTSKSTGGKILAMWLPILIFFGQGFEHTVVNMFVIPAGMLLGANVSGADWLLWSGIPVLLGNFVGGTLLTGLLLYWGQKYGGKRHSDAGIPQSSAAGSANANAALPGAAANPAASAVSINEPVRAAALEKSV
ncbi:formate/nitrite transporter family protein [Saccharibacillus sp. CPCC 101409]|uniref:formate/nitrite transporter family protein n=1 Tax=Saccharibacillus sp. CPCC 101409 TaxID=3058041 RepID=UPI002672AB60|nr:formate/nitrite transporter family protein [Saccharibacillus sp. CPCC 101409]MDO3411629.1 formate/nitrite transporter family protein [Saccharibacillus sp. CPCC 101409]